MKKRRKKNDYEKKSYHFAPQNEVIYSKKKYFFFTFKCDLLFLEFSKIGESCCIILEKKWPSAKAKQWRLLEASLAIHQKKSCMFNYY